MAYCDVEDFARKAYLLLGDSEEDLCHHVPFDRLTDGQKNDWRNAARQWEGRFRAWSAKGQKTATPIEEITNPDWHGWKTAYDESMVSGYAAVDRFHRQKISQKAENDPANPYIGRR